MIFVKNLFSRVPLFESNVLSVRMRLASNHKRKEGGEKIPNEMMDDELPESLITEKSRVEIKMK